jgi:hypothetical protein
MAKSNKQRFGVFYRSNGRWAGPYCGMSFTKYSIERNSVKADIRYFANYILKSRVKLAPVG